ncbi:probable E3 ubiquitin-protein ligase RHB1A [Mangifera indica]|uniref:probable E3 ubiquitin-protein ligase RHB1A n=1 Tax=Mangifera indica TaxID=29780 RepID=UPI001CFB22CE|nr:probable E3 ubiquitin-protein ligase RHB1A [Mangifera indica]XP_044477021.1 probable E3 ubiquitin-protein ligase RHB1A [Mangifera indica]
MGGCCCCSSKGAERNSSPAYYYYPRASEEHVPFSSHHGATSAIPTGLLVDTNLDTSVPDAYRPPPAPIPFDVSLRHHQTPPVTQEICSNKSDAPVQTTTDSVQDTGDGDTGEPVKCEDLKESEDKTHESAKELEVELSKSVEPAVSVIEEEDVCPTCLEGYDTENPRIITKCEHHFHLACILEWMERSDTCPVCDKEMIFDLPNE